jgi:hypothetical protein
MFHLTHAVKEIIMVRAVRSLPRHPGIEKTYRYYGVSCRVLLTVMINICTVRATWHRYIVARSYQLAHTRRLHMPLPSLIGTLPGRTSSLLKQNMNPHSPHRICRNIYSSRDQHLPPLSAVQRAPPPPHRSVSQVHCIDRHYT